MRIEEDDCRSKGDEESETEGGGEEEHMEDEEGRDDDHSPTAMRERTKGGEGLGLVRGDDDDTASLQQLCL